MLKTACGIFMILVIICSNCFSQSRKYLYFGLELGNYENLEPLGKIINDYNSYHESVDIVTLHKLTLPLYSQGYMIGTKIHERFSEFGGNVHFNQYSTMAQGSLDNGAEYYEKLIITHNGFNIHWRGLLINTNYFRTGPGIGFLIEQFRIKLNYNEDPSINTMVPASKALFSGQINYNFSFGGPKFNMDLGVFYQIPFWKVNLSKLNTNLNLGFANDYPEVEMALKSASYGLSFCISFGSKENFNF